MVGKTCDIIIQQPNQTFKPVLFESDNALRVLTLVIIPMFLGQVLNESLFHRNVDFSLTGWIFVGVLSILFLLQITIIIITMIDPGMIEGMLTEYSTVESFHIRALTPEYFLRSRETGRTNKTGPESYVWNSHYSNQVDKTGTPKTGA